MKNQFYCSLVLFFGIMIFNSSCQSDDEQNRVITSAYPIHDTDNIFSEDELAALNTVLDFPNGFEHEYDFKSPQHVGGRNFEIDNAEATLGRVLFYDKELSMDRSVSCASCHLQEKGFADQLAFSEGVNDNHTDRNSIAIGVFVSIQNHYGGGSSTNRLFWDGRAEDFKEQMVETFQNTNEMGISMDEMVDRVAAKDYYQILFEKVYHNPYISENRILKALETFMSSISAANTRFDHALDVMPNDTEFTHDFTNLTVSENLGKELFFYNCKNCHGGTITSGLSSNVSMANNGLAEIYDDLGSGGVTSLTEDNGVFKIPSLRNIEVTGPYMHDGRFETLEEVIDFYSSEIQGHPNLHSTLKTPTGEPRQFNFTTEEKEALIDFLKTLTDPVVNHHPRFSDPFKD